MTKIFWKCPDDKLKKSNLFKFESFLKKKYGLNHKYNYEKIMENGQLKIQQNFGNQFGNFQISKVN